MSDSRTVGKLLVNAQQTLEDAGIANAVQEALWRLAYAWCHSRHLADDIGHRCQNQADHGHDACSLGIESIADELGYRIFAELKL